MTQTTQTVGVTDPHEVARQIDKAAREALATLRGEVNHQYAATLACAAARMLHDTFGPSARRAVIERCDSEDGGISIYLLAVFDRADNLIWFDGCLEGTDLVAAREKIAADGGPPIPVLDKTTREAIEDLCEQAEDAPDGYFIRCGLDTEPDLPYEGYTLELNINEEAARRNRLAGPAAPDGSTGPQKRLLTPRDRALTVQVLRTVTDALTNHRDRPIRSAIRVDVDSAQRLLDIADVLDPKEHP